MIITCPECDTRFIVPSTVFMRGGRKMKCASCAHQWFQDEPLEKSEAVKKFARDLDKGQKKTSKKSSGEGFLPTLKQEIIDGKFFVIGGFSCVLIIFFIIHLMSSAPLIMGQGLAFHNIAIKRDNGDMTLIGEIVNTMNEKRGVPTLQIAELLHDDLLGNTHLIKPEKEILNADETLKITLQLPAIAHEVRNLKIGFEGSTPQNKKSNNEPKENFDHH